MTKSIILALGMALAFGGVSQAFAENHQKLLKGAAVHKAMNKHSSVDKAKVKKVETNQYSKRKVGR